MSNFYLIAITVKSAEYFLLWADGGDEPDFYLRDEYKKGLVVTRSVDTLKCIAMERNIDLVTTEPINISIEQM